MPDVVYTFPLFSLGNRIDVTDGAGSVLYTVRQKFFRLRERIGVESADGTTFDIQADRVIDFSASYHISSGGHQLGSVRRRGMRSLWSASYEIYAGDQPFARLNETNPMAKVMDGLFGQIPVLGLLTGYLFHPSYSVTLADGHEIARVTKQPAFLEGRFWSDEEAPGGRVGPAERTLLRLGVLTMLLMERDRG
jgi:hypothetical protein